MVANFDIRSLSLPSSKSTLIVSGSLALTLSVFGAIKVFRKKDGKKEVSVEKLQTDILQYLKNDSKNAVINDPQKAIFYTVACKVIGLFVAIIMPFIGHGIFFGSIFLIDLKILGNFKEFSSKFIASNETLKRIATTWGGYIGYTPTE